jgi:hypothetical protein
MSLDTIIPARSRLPVSWWTVGVFAVVLAAADGFWSTSLRGAIGYINATQEPFRDWLLYLAVMLPIFGTTVLGALWLAQRFFGGRRTGARLAAAAALVVVLTTGVGVAQIALTSVYDYRAQANQVVQIHHLHADAGARLRFDPGAALPADVSTCTGTCAGKRDTLAIHVRAVKIAVIVLLLTNALLVLWALALRGGQVWVRRRTAGPAVGAAVTETDTRTTVGIA